MSIAGNLERWRSAGLIDAPTAERIVEFERARRRPLLAYALGGLGALTVAVGVISVVAANWDELGRFAKLGLDLAVLGALAFGIARVQNRWGREVLVILYFGATLASIALIAQVYQLGGSTFSALLLWLVLATPVAVLGRSWLLAAAWLAGICALTGFGLDALFDRWHPHDRIEIAVSVAAASVILTGSIFGGRSAWLRAHRPGFAGWFQFAGWLAFVVGTSLAQHLWYARIAGHERLVATVPVPLLLGAVLVVAVPRLLADVSPGAVLAVRIAVAFGTLSSLVPIVIVHGDLDFVGALSFMALWLGFAVACHQLGRVNLLNLATAVLALRVIIAYVELFGSLLQTGIAMIIGGALTIGLAWLWMRKARDFRREAREREVAAQ